MVLRVIPQWGVPRSGKHESLFDDIKWVVTTVVLTWITLFLYNHFYGWYRVVDWGSTPKCPRRNPPDPRDGLLTVRVGEFRDLQAYVRRMEDRILELEGQVLSPSPPYSEERSRSSVSADDGSDSGPRGSVRPMARRLTRMTPPPPPPISQTRDDVQEESDIPNAQPGPVDLRARNRRLYMHNSMGSPSSSNSSSSRGRKGYYAVRGGPYQGVYTSWADASQAIGRGTVHQLLPRYEDALAFVQGDPIRFGWN